jgi:prophage regulatory protein
MAILRIPKALEETGLGRTKFYAFVRDGLMVEPVSIGGRASGVPSEELLAINRARIAGATDDQVRALVKRLHEARQQAAEGLAA